MKMLVRVFLVSLVGCSSAPPPAQTHEPTVFHREIDDDDMVGDAKLGDALDAIGRRAGRTIVVDPVAAARDVRASGLKGMTWRQAADELAKRADCTVEERGSELVVTPRRP